MNENAAEHSLKRGRIPPGQLLTKRFPVLHYGSIPPFDPETWTFRVWGEVENRSRLPGRSSASYRVQRSH